LSDDGLLSIESVIRDCIERERLSVRLYTKAMDLVTDPTSRKLLEAFRAEEVNHIKLLKQALENKGESKLGTVQTEADYSSGSGAPIDIDENATPGQLVLFAIQHEERAIDYFTRYVTTFRGTELGELFERLLREEESHREKLKTKFARYL
jgi:rubrerythrin